MFDFTTIRQYHRQLINNEIDCVQAVRHYLQKIADNTDLNSFVEVYAEEALQKAADFDRERRTGKPLKKLHGVIIAIKDVICYKGHKVSAASGILQNFTSIYTASALQHLLNEEAIIIGNCNCDEFAMGSSNENSIYGSVKNAADHSRVPGGSSGGSAVAVQAGMCMLSLGSDTGGSVRQPADFCGIIGLKPGYGTISRYGLIAYASSFDQIGIFGKEIEDVALLLEIMQQPDQYDSTLSRWKSGIEKKTKEGNTYNFCYFRQALQHRSLDKEISTSILYTIRQLKEKGHSVTEIDFDLLDYIVPAYYVLTTAEASSNLSRYDGIRYGYGTTDTKGLDELYVQSRTEGFGKEVKRRIMLGTFVLSAGYFDAYYNKAQKVRRMLTSRVDEIFKEFDAILSPTSPTPAFRAGQSQKDPTEMYLADIYTVMANLTGIPGISLPLFSHSYSIPFGLQVMTKREDEVSLLRISEMLLGIKVKHA